MNEDNVQGMNLKKSQHNQQRCGFIAVLGKPNAGKSTLINGILGAKVSIVSHKAQTTRRRVLGIHVQKTEREDSDPSSKVYDETQFIFIDTPGIFQASRFMEKAMVKEAFTAGFEADNILLLIDSFSKNPQGVIGDLQDLIQDSFAKKKIFIAFNKVDCLKDKVVLLEKVKEVQDFLKDKLTENKGIDLGGVFLISALKHEGIDVLLEALKKNLPVGPFLFPEDQLSDMPDRIFASEITREQLYLQLQQELPYQAYVETETFEYFKDGSIKICQSIVLAKDSQKSIVLGQGGSRIKQISQKSRLELEAHLGTKVHLFLFVKIRDKWMEKKGSLSAIGIME